MDFMSYLDGAWLNGVPQSYGGTGYSTNPNATNPLVSGHPDHWVSGPADKHSHGPNVRRQCAVRSENGGRDGALHSGAR